MVVKQTTWLLSTALAVPLLASETTLSSVAQTAPAPSAADASQTSAISQAQPNTASQPSPTDSKTYATGQPLSVQSNEGFWGHLNPFARKKWVNRQVNPVKDRLNELDQLSAKNGNDIKDVDQRAQAGIHQAQSTADQASQQAASANSTASQAQQLAQQSGTRTQQLGSTVANLDQYQTVSDTEIHFRPGQLALNSKAKDALDGIASQLQGQKGYLIEVQGYSRAKGQAGIQSSEKLANAVVRYLVEDHQVPVYRVHVLGMGNAALQSSDNSTTTGNATTGSVVHVTLVQNSLAALNSSGSSGSSPIGATQQPANGQSPRSAPSSPSAPQQQ
ncbi:OmpA family protein [Acidisarcina polymorpha]|uniref:OmpA family protein n=1 Tax=Acidisarcina polymorpha TaxID=2211140 RepID=UPI001374E08E|nr:OmpA family protein [Acidisarcina polymorpha]